MSIGTGPGCSYDGLAGLVGLGVGLSRGHTGRRRKGGFVAL